MKVPHVHSAIEMNRVAITVMKKATKMCGGLPRTTLEAEHANDGNFDHDEETIVKVSFNTTAHFPIAVDVLEEQIP